MENGITIPFGIQVPEPSELAPYLGRGIDLSAVGGTMSVRWDPDARAKLKSRITSSLIPKPEPADRDTTCHCGTGCL